MKTVLLVDDSRGTGQINALLRTGRKTGAASGTGYFDPVSVLGVTVLSDVNLIPENVRRITDVKIFPFRFVKTEDLQRRPGRSLQ